MSDPLSEDLAIQDFLGSFSPTTAVGLSGDSITNRGIG